MAWALGIVSLSLGLNYPEEQLLGISHSCLYPRPLFEAGAEGRDARHIVGRHSLSHLFQLNQIAKTLCLEE